MIILGLDPGLENTGYGVIEVSGNQYRHLASGTLKTSADQPLAVRLTHLASQLTTVLVDHKPAHAAVEETFVNVNARSSLKLGHARGICLLIPQQHGVPVAEYAARLVKKSIVGSGRAEKHQIGHMVRVLLPTAKPTTEDAADALAVALTHAHHLSYAKLLNK
jgi:crossover junction endodeoxyribonuclease RuvC